MRISTNHTTYQNRKGKQIMSRIFTDEELQEMIIPTSTRIRNAFQSGDKETAKKLWNKLVDDYMWAFDLRVNWDKAFTDYIYNELGGDALYEVWRYRGWTEEQIRPMKINEEIRQKGLQLIEDGTDYPTFDELLNKEYFKFRHSHDKRIEWETIIMGYVYEHGGPEALWSTMASVTPKYWQGMIDAAVNGTYKDAVLQQILGLETHGEPLEIMEDDEKVVVWMRLLSRKLNDALSSRLFYVHFDSHRDISHFKSSCFCELFF